MKGNNTLNSSLPLGDPVLEIPAPSRGRIGWGWLGLVLVIGAVTLLMVLCLKYLLTHLIGGPFIVAMVAVLGVSLFIIVDCARRVNEKSRRSSETPQDCIKIYKDRIYVPAYLSYKQTGDIWLPIKNIVDFEQLRLGKSPLLLAFSLKGETGKKYYYDTLEKHDIAALYKTLHGLSGLSENFSPFGRRAQKLRTEKNIARQAGIALAVLCFFGLILLLIFWPFTRLYSGMGSLTLYALGFSLLISRFLMKGVLSRLFRKRDGSPLTFWGLLAVLQCLFMFLLFSCTIFFAGELKTEDVVVAKKARVKNKSSYSYRLKFELENDSSFYPVSFSELSFVRTSSRIYSQVQPGKTMLQVTYAKGPFGLSVLYGYRILGPLHGLGRDGYKVRMVASFDPPVDTYLGL